MLGIKDLKKELAETNIQMKSISLEIARMSEKILKLAEEVSNSMNIMTNELRETNITIRESLKTTSDAIISMSDNFSKALEKAMLNMQEMKIQMNIKDTILKSLGIENILPDFLKKK